MLKNSVEKTAVELLDNTVTNHDGLLRKLEAWLGELTSELEQHSATDGEADEAAFRV
jgi:hypothetical protein